MASPAGHSTDGAAPKRRLSIARREALWGYLFVAPWIIGFVAFSAIPIVWAFCLSFTDYSMFESPKWIGVDNYRTILTEDRLFWTVVRNTLYYVAASVPLQMAIGLGVALLLNQKVRWVAFWRTAFYLPVMVPYIVSSVLFVWIFEPRVGVLRYLLEFVNIESPLWLQSETWSKPAIILLSLWHMGSYMIIFLAGLQGIPESFYEAAAIDGASAWNKFANITIPMLTPVILYNLVVGVINSFQVFTFAYIMTQGGPLNSTTFYVYYIYQRGFQFFEMGYASALAVMLFVVVLLITVGLFKWSNRWAFYEGESQAGGSR